MYMFLLHPSHWIPFCSSRFTHSLLKYELSTLTPTITTTTTDKPWCCTEYLHRGPTRSGVITTATGVGSPGFSSTRSHYSLFGMYAFILVASAIEWVEDYAFIDIKASVLYTVKFIIGWYIHLTTFGMLLPYFMIRPACNCGSPHPLVIPAQLMRLW